MSFEIYYVIDGLENTVGSAYFNDEKKCYTVDVPFLDGRHDFKTFEEMIDRLNEVGLDAV